MAKKNANGDFYRYGITDSKYKIIDGADTREDVLSLVRGKYNDIECHVVKVDANGYFNGIVLL